MKKKIYSLLLAFVLSSSCITSCSNKKQDPLQEGFDYVPEITHTETPPTPDYTDTKGILLIYIYSSMISDVANELYDYYTDIKDFYLENGTGPKGHYLEEYLEFKSLVEGQHDNVWILDGFHSNSLWHDIYENVMYGYDISEQTYKCLNFLYYNSFDELDDCVSLLSDMCFELHLTEDKRPLNKDAKEIITLIKDFKSINNKARNAANYYPDILTDWCTETTARVCANYAGEKSPEYLAALARVLAKQKEREGKETQELHTVPTEAEAQAQKAKKNKDNYEKTHFPPANTPYNGLLHHRVFKTKLQG